MVAFIVGVLCLAPGGNKKTARSWRLVRFHVSLSSSEHTIPSVRLWARIAKKAPKSGEELDHVLRDTGCGDICHLFCAA
jgi:hypothetical protein